MISNFYSILTLLLLFTVLFGYINARFIKLPDVIGIMLLSLISSVLLVISGNLIPNISRFAVRTISNIDFEQVILQMFLGFLLFAGAVHVDIRRLRQERNTIIMLATIGILISTAVVGVSVYYIFNLTGTHIPLMYCLLFGALISPTDPIAVLGILKKARVPAKLEIRITGESLFNDGVALVVFVTLLTVAHKGLEHLSFWQTGWLFIREAMGGILWGFILGFAGFFILKTIDNYQLEVLITIVMVMGGYSFAQWLGISGPLAMVIAGLITGSRSKRYAMSERSRDYLEKFWELLDEIMNALLFLLVGFEMLAIRFTWPLIETGLIAILIVLIARFISVYIPMQVLSLWRKAEQYKAALLTWGALRGALSIALALSLPEDFARHEIVVITYIVVIFSISVQGLTIGKVAKKMSGKI